MLVLISLVIIILIILIRNGFEIKSYNESSIKTDFIQIGIIVFGLFLLFTFSLGSYNSSDTEIPKNPVVNKCEGDESCLYKVEERFGSTGKKILSEKYIGNGIFIVEFFDQKRIVSGSAKVTTNCNCEITDVNVSIHQ